MAEQERITVLVTVKAYPQPSSTYSEAVCVAGIRTDVAPHRWVRLYPIAFRDLPRAMQFTKYSEISVLVSPSSDTRPESVRPDPSSIEIVRQVDTKDAWAERRAVVEPLIVESMCTVFAQQQIDGTSLGAFRPAAIEDVVVSPESAEWSAQQLLELGQLSFTAQEKQMLEKIPWRWRIHYTCWTDGCGGHKQTLIDWEAAAAWRSWRRTMSAEEAAERVRLKWLNEVCGPEKDVVLFVGNQHQHPKGFLLLGVFWPPLSRPPARQLGFI